MLTILRDVCFDSIWHTLPPSTPSVSRSRLGAVLRSHQYNVLYIQSGPKKAVPQF